MEKLYVLPYGQMSLWGRTVITNMLSAIPWIGQDFVQFIWGGLNTDEPFNSDIVLKILLDAGNSTRFLREKTLTISVYFGILNNSDVKITDVCGQSAVVDHLKIGYSETKRRRSLSLLSRFNRRRWVVYYLKKW